MADDPPDGSHLNGYFPVSAFAYRDRPLLQNGSFSSTRISCELADSELVFFKEYIITPAMVHAVEIWLIDRNRRVHHPMVGLFAVAF
jgi:hypothetical protein